MIIGHESRVHLFYNRIMEFFGSNTRGDSNPASDIDLWVITYEDDWRLAIKDGCILKRHGSKHEFTTHAD